MATLPQSMPFEDIDVTTFAQRLEADPTAFQLIDVREPQELEIASVPGFEVLPLSQFGQWSGDIHSRFDADKETVVMCHHGMRSAQMCAWLSQQGFTNLKNLQGGIDAYSAAIDPSIPRY